MTADEERKWQGLSKAVSVSHCIKQHQLSLALCCTKTGSQRRRPRRKSYILLCSKPVFLSHTHTTEGIQKTDKSTHKNLQTLLLPPPVWETNTESEERAKQQLSESSTELFFLSPWQSQRARTNDWKMPTATVNGFYWDKIVYCVKSTWQTSIPHPQQSFLYLTELLFSWGHCSVQIWEEETENIDLGKKDGTGNTWKHFKSVVFPSCLGTLPTDTESHQISNRMMCSLSSSLYNPPIHTKGEGREQKWICRCPDATEDLIFIHAQGQNNLWELQVSSMWELKAVVNTIALVLPWK